jgi:hypothetical protein
MATARFSQTLEYFSIPCGLYPKTDVIYSSCLLHMQVFKLYHFMHPPVGSSLRPVRSETFVFFRQSEVSDPGR